MQEMTLVDDFRLLSHRAKFLLAEFMAEVARLSSGRRDVTTNPERRRVAQYGEVIVYRREIVRMGERRYIVMHGDTVIQDVGHHREAMRIARTKNDALRELALHERDREHPEGDNAT